MHLHGHKFQVVGINGRPINGALRDTAMVPMMSTVIIAFDADNSGRWPFQLSSPVPYGERDDDTHRVQGLMARMLPFIPGSICCYLQGGGRCCPLPED
ncbi:multicopper oxidase domain-containing protein [Rhizobium sp. BK399]|uniref:multicopper oxidase domain-containing protein n=1 Tax=Rhizobium sp. BK399 TaxID=2587063 RepID=UPI001FED5A14|nr:multicopper oxidase domain-containing protein [Rhizobium sp. BK399]